VALNVVRSLFGFFLVIRKYWGHICYSHHREKQSNCLKDLQERGHFHSDTLIKLLHSLIQAALASPDFQGRDGPVDGLLDFYLLPAIELAQDEIDLD